MSDLVQQTVGLEVLERLLRALYEREGLTCIREQRYRGVGERTDRRGWRTIVARVDRLDRITVHGENEEQVRQRLLRVLLGHAGPELAVRRAAAEQARHEAERAAESLAMKRVRAVEAAAFAGSLADALSLAQSDGHVDPGGAR